MMYLYGLVYNASLYYKTFAKSINQFLSPLTELKKKIVPQDSIEYSFEIDSFGKKNVLYQQTYAYFFYYTFLMFFVYGKTLWSTEFNRKQSSILFNINGSNSQNIVYVRLSNGKEYLSRGSFNSIAINKHPKRSYLCMYLNKLDISAFYKRFLASWSNLNITVIEFLMIAKHLHTQVNYMTNDAGLIIKCITDEEFDEVEFKSNDIIKF